MAAVVCWADPHRQRHLWLAAELLVRENQLWGWCVFYRNAGHPLPRAGHAQLTEATLHHGDLVSSRYQHWAYDVAPNGVGSAVCEIAGVLYYEGEWL